MKTILPVLIVFGICGISQAQSPSVPVDKIILPTSSLSISNVNKTNVRVGALFGPMWCGDEGAVYARVMDTSGKFLASAVTKIHDKKPVLFPLNNIAESNGEQPEAWISAGDSSGAVYYVVRFGLDKQYLVTLSASGTFVSKVALDNKLQVFQFLHLPSGNFFLSGLIESDKPDSPKTAAASFSWLVDADGKLVRDISRKDDQLAVEKVGNPPVLQNSAIQRGLARLGSDGFIYVLKGTSPPHVMIYSQAGELVREVTPLLPLENAQSTDLITGESTFLLKLHQLTKKDGEARKLYWAEYSSETGEPRAVFDITGLKGQVICLKDNSFTILTFTQDGYFAIGKASK